MENNIPRKYIDLDAVLEKKAPRIYKFLPGFLLSWLKKTVHQDDLNRDLNILEDYHGLRFFDKFTSMMEWNILVEGADNIPRDGRFIFVSNHPLGGPDGIMLISAIGRYKQKVRFLVNDLLMYLPNVETVFLPVNKLGHNPKEYSRIMDEAFDDADSQILIFPAGLVSRKIKGQVADLEWKKSFVSRAKKHKRDVIPLYFEGRNSEFFYNFARVRKSLGIKFNLEMLFLVDELYKKRGGTFVVKVGKPIPHATFDTSKQQEQWAEWVRQEVYALGKKT